MVRRKLIFLLGLLLFLAACQSTAPLPTLVPPITLPDGTVVTVTPTFTAVPLSLANQRPSGSLATAVPLPPTPQGVGLRPLDAEQKYLPDAGLLTSNDNLRPPSYDAPLAFNPDDHYWFIRPIPSGYRNYDLEWYPYGNDVLAAGVPAYRVHHGLDFPNPSGTPILAAASGTVIHAGPLPSPRDGVNYYGNTVIIEHDWQWQGQDLFTLYAHTLELFVAEGDRVEQGQLIAGVGSSGEVTGPHLHFEVRVGSNNYNDTRNPALWIAPYQGWGTLAGRFTDRRGRMVGGASLQLRPLPLTNGQTVREQETYHLTVSSDEVWQENFVFADVPAGDYQLIIDMNDGVHRYRREVTVYPGQTSFVIISDNFDFYPTATPIPTAVPTPTPLAIFLPPEEPGDDG